MLFNIFSHRSEKTDFNSFFEKQISPSLISRRPSRFPLILPSAFLVFFEFSHSCPDYLTALFLGFLRGRLDEVPGGGRAHDGLLRPEHPD